MYILGVDPGLQSTGWGVIEVSPKVNSLTHVAHGVITTPSQQSLAVRLLTIHQQLTALFTAYSVKQLAVEALVFSKNVTSALPVAHARGVVLLCASQFEAAVHSFSPNTIKQTVTGNGRASKADVQKMVKILLKMKQLPSPDHAADALACAIAAAYGATTVTDSLA